MKRTFSLIVLMAVMCSCLAMTAHAADYSFTTAASVDYYDYTSYEDAYGSQYNYGGSNVVDYQIPELERRPVSWKNLLCPACRHPFRLRPAEIMA